MAQELIKIPVSMLQEAKPFARDIFLRMPKNRKMLLIIRRDDEIRPNLLARLRASPDIEIFAQPLEGDTAVAENLPLYSVAAPKETQEPAFNSTPAVEINSSELASESESVINNQEFGRVLPFTRPAEGPPPQEKRASNAIEKNELLKIEGAKSGQESSDSSVSDAFQTSESIFSIEENSDHLTRSFDAVPPLSEPTSTFGSNATDSEIIALPPAAAEAEPEVHIATQWPENAPETILTSAEKEQEKGSELRSFLDPSEKEPENRVPASAPSKATEDALVTDFKKSVDDPGIHAGAKPKSDIHTAANQLESAAEAVLASRKKKREEGRQVAAILERAALKLSAFSTDSASHNSESRDEIAASLSDSLQEIAVREESGEKIADETRELREFIQSAKEMILKGETGAPALQTLSSHIVDLVEEVRVSHVEPIAETTFAQTLADAVEDLRKIAGEASPTEIEIELLRDKLEHSKEELAFQLSITPDKDTESFIVKNALEQAINSLPYSSRAAKAYRETPQIAARLATLLAHALGYASPGYLYEIALATQLYFTKKNGIRVEVPIESVMATLALDSFSTNTEEAGSPLGDSSSIVTFLDHYFDHPQCDRTQIEFGKTAFESTLRELEKAAKPTNEWTAARWRYFIEKGTPVTTLSLCAKASAKALKTTRTLIKDSHEQAP